jgi:hypothetical protein
MALVVTGLLPERRRFALRGGGFGVGLAALMLGACAGGPPRPDEVLDCTVEEDYEFLPIQFLEPGAEVPWYSYGDPSVGSITTVAIVEIPGGRCESTGALVLTSRGHKDWGSGFGEYTSATSPTVATDYEGVSFWARALGYGSSTGFQLTLQDRNTHTAGMVCLMAGADQVASGQYTVNEAGMTVPVGTDLPAPEDCGNGFQTVVAARREWTLHTIPFEAFRQLPQPNLIPSGIDRSGIYQFTVNVPKDANLELWIDNISAYRRRPEAAVTE